MTRFTFDSVASPLHDEASLAEVTHPVTTALGALGGVEGTGENPATPHVVVVATGGTERAVIDAIDRREASGSLAPALLVAHPRHNALPAALEALAALRQRDRRGRIVLLDDPNAAHAPNNGATPDELATAIEDLHAWHRLHSTRLGVVGRPSDWLVASTPDAAIVSGRWGPELVEVAIPDAISAYDEVPVELGRRVVDRLGGSPSVTLPRPDHVDRAGRLDPALRTVIDRDDLDAITVRCFDFLGSIETSGCVALAQLNDDGIVAGCEGDVPAALAMLWVRALLDRPSWIANPATVRIDRDELVLAHCTIAPSMVDDLELSTHFESGIGVGLHGRLRASDVTLVRIGGRGLDRRWIAEGRVVDSGAEPDLCRTQATVRVDRGEVGELLDDPLGNHLVVVDGRHRDRLERWWRWAIA